MQIHLHSCQLSCLFHPNLHGHILTGHYTICGTRNCSWDNTTAGAGCKVYQLYLVSSGNIVALGGNCKKILLCIHRFDLLIPVRNGTLMQEHKDLLIQICSSIQLLTRHQTEYRNTGFAWLLVYMVHCIRQVLHKCQREHNPEILLARPELPTPSHYAVPLLEQIHSETSPIHPPYTRRYRLY